MALHLKLRSHHSSFIYARLLSTSSPFPPPPASSEDPSQESQSQQSSFSSIFKSSPSAPRRIPLDPPPPPSLSEAPVASLDDIRNNLASFRLRYNSPSASSSASSSNISFQKIFKDNVLNNPPAPDAKRPSFTSFDSIRESLRQSQSRNDHVNLNSLQESLRGRIAEAASGQPSFLGSSDSLPESIFGREARKLKKEEEEEEQNMGLTTQFLKSYSEAELGEKLRQLRPEESEKKGFSLTEMNERLAKLRKMEEDSSYSGIYYKDIRGSLARVMADDKKKNGTIFP